MMEAKPPGEDAAVTGSDLVTVEFYGVPRQRAGQAALVVPSGRVAELLASVERACPGLTGLVQSDGRLAPHYLLSINGREFITDLQRSVAPGEQLLVLSADAGG